MNQEIKDWILACQNDKSKTTMKVFGDWLEEHGDRRATLLRRTAELDDTDWSYSSWTDEFPESQQDSFKEDVYSWRQAFAYAGKEQGCNQGVPERALPNDSDTSVEPFGLLDVKRVIAASAGMNDESNWLVVGELNDGRYFVVDAGCDYTGWD